MSDNGKTHETQNGSGQNSKDQDELTQLDPSMYVVVIGQQSPHSLQHLQMLAALYGWDLLVMAEHGLSVATSGMTMQPNTYALVRILEER